MELKNTLYFGCAAICIEEFYGYPGQQERLRNMIEKSKCCNLIIHLGDYQLSKCANQIRTSLKELGFKRIHRFHNWAHAKINEIWFYSPPQIAQIMDEDYNTEAEIDQYNASRTLMVDNPRLWAEYEKMDALLDVDDFYDEELY